MIALYILSGVLVLCLLLLFSSVSLKALYTTDFLAEVKFWFVKFKFPKDKSNKKPKTQQKEKQSEKKQNYISKLIEEKGILSAVNEIADIVKSICSEFGKLLKHIRVNKFSLAINVASDDPAVTAVEYGSICAVVYPMVRLIEANTKFNHKSTKVDVNSDFVSTSPSLDFDVEIKIRLVFILAAALKIFIKLVKNKMNQQKLVSKNKSLIGGTENKNGRQ